MPNPTSHELRDALSNDLNHANSESLKTVVNDETRKTFTVRVAGAILEFAHKQPDSAYWNGVKYYGAGSNSKIRIKRSAQEAVAEVAEK